ncbi:DUF2157 domain-containing protein [Streptomonospora sp. PA3]|uniref:DUF2157 domain-containing protein n=1 Tax=Streptomonospora sp. PA3 TaxID=2607326 RepID=UPI0016427EDC
MSESKPARQAALRGLVERGVISSAQAEEVRAALEAADAGPGRVRWTEIAGYIGGGLVLAGGVALATAYWEELSRDLRIGLLAVLAVVAVGGAMVMTGGPQEMRGRRHRLPDVRRRVAGVLLALAAVLAAFSVGIAVDGEPLYLPALVGVAVAAAGYAALPTAVGHVTTWWLAAALAALVVRETGQPDPGDEFLAIGGAWLGLGLAWAALSALGAAAERRLGLGLGAGLALAAGQFLLGWGADGAWGYGATLAVAAACLAYYYADRTAVLLVLGILGITVGLPEMVWDLTDGAIGAAAVLLLAGAVLLVASWLGIRLHRRGNGPQSPAAPSGPPAAGPAQQPADDAGPRPSAGP